MTPNPFNRRSPHFRPAAYTGRYVTEHGHELGEHRSEQHVVAVDPAAGFPPSLPAQMLQPLTQEVPLSLPPPGSRSQAVAVKPVEPVVGPSTTERILDFLVEQQRQMAERAPVAAPETSAPVVELPEAQDLFGRMGQRVDEFCAAVAPAAAGQLLAARKRLGEGDPEALTHCATSCRRALKSVADAVFPAQDDPHIDRSGKEREVGEE